MAFQSRFRWRHRDTDPWARLMDATCFPVDFIGRPRGPSLSQYGGHWSHVITCAHVVCPWEYPNFYPPAGQTKWVAKLTLADTMSQVRLVSVQGQCIYRHFASQHHTFLHRNPRLDIAVLHSEQNMKRTGEMKMLWMQNEGYVIRPRFELLEELKEGDHCWIYGMAANSQLFDEEAPADPYMIPTGIRAKVKHLEEEHFFLEPLEGEPEITMGMCGSPIMRSGRCVGMLTSSVHEGSENRKLAGTGMCSYAHDIRAFLMEVEKQMNNAVQYHEKDSIFMGRRKEEGFRPPEYREWDTTDSRVARHIPVPASQWKLEENWATEEDRLSGDIFARGGPFNQETQENFFGMDMNTANSQGHRPENLSMAGGEGGGKPHACGERPDKSPTAIWAPHESWKERTEWDSVKGQEAREYMHGAVNHGDAETVDKLRRSIEFMQRRRHQETVKESVLKNAPGDERMQERIQQEKEEFELRKQRRKQAPRPWGGDEAEGLWGEH